MVTIVLLAFANISRTERASALKFRMHYEKKYEQYFGTKISKSMKTRAPMVLRLCGFCDLNRELPVLLSESKMNFIGPFA